MDRPTVGLDVVLENQTPVFQPVFTKLLYWLIYPITGPVYTFRSGND